jgi:hypothetical protein
MPRATTLQKGWASMCFATDSDCLMWMGKVAMLEPRHVRFDFEVQPRLWGQAGIPATISALMVLPYVAGANAPGPLSAGVEDFSSSHRQ